MVTYSTLELGLNKESARKILGISWRVGALLQGEFTLVSGKKSSHYYDGKKVTLSPEGAYWVGKAIFEELAEVEVDAVGGLAIGADPIVAAVALISHLEGKPIPSFIVRDRPKEHGTMREIEGHLKEGYRVAIVDDVITRGGSIMRAIKAVETAGCKVVKVIALVDRHEGGSDKLKEAHYDFTAVIHLWPSGEVTLDESSTIEGEARAGILHQ